MKKNIALVILFWVTLFSGCTKKPIGQQGGLAPACALSKIEDNACAMECNRVKSKNLVSQAKQQILPIPVGYKLKECSESSSGLMKSKLFVYVGSLNFNKLVTFYKKELELGGWDYSDLSTKKEGMLIANKDCDKCVVSVRPLKENCSAVYIFVQDKNFESFSGLSDPAIINGVWR